MKKMSKFNRNSNNSKSTFKVVIYESEVRQIQAWTAKFPNFETGGDLFGLWLDETTAVVQLVLGPGTSCRRSTVSFYQDVGYLAGVGNHLTKNQGLCHIGEWHSHHQLGLTRPSGGDKNTVWSNMVRYGIHRFVLFIATIRSSWTRKGTIVSNDIDGYLFQIDRENGYGMPLQHASSKVFETISTISPFRKPNEECITCGAESVNSDEDLNMFRKKSITKDGQEQNAITEESSNGRSDDDSGENSDGVMLPASDEKGGSKSSEVTPSRGNISTTSPFRKPNEQSIASGTCGVYSDNEPEAEIVKLDQAKKLSEAVVDSDKTNNPNKHPDNTKKSHLPNNPTALSKTAAENQTGKENTITSEDPNDKSDKVPSSSSTNITNITVKSVMTSQTTSSPEQAPQDATNTHETTKIIDEDPKDDSKDERKTPCPGFC